MIDFGIIIKKNSIFKYFIIFILIYKNFLNLHIKILLYFYYKLNIKLNNTIIIYQKRE